MISGFDPRGLEYRRFGLGVTNELLGSYYDRPGGLMIGQSGDAWKYTAMRIGWRYVAKCHYEGLGWIMEMSPPRGYRIHEFREETQIGDGF
jgi:hypothetical protein